jgi:hypothetical protein
LAITFFQSKNGKKLEGSWLLRMKSSDLAKEWWDKLNK